MLHPLPQPRRDLPRWVILGGSAAIAIHLVALLFLVLGAHSGPWQTMNFGRSPAEPPMFAAEVDKFIRPWYFRILSMSHDYHFSKNDPEEEGVYLEALLKDRDGKVVETLSIPDRNESFWVQERQTLLALSVADDIPVQAPRSEVIPGVDKKVRTVTIWDAPEGSSIQKARPVTEMLIPRNREVYRPTERALLLAQSYARYLCRSHHVPTVELIRHSRRPIMPEAMLMADQLSDWVDEQASFGDYSVE